MGLRIYAVAASLIILSAMGIALGIYTRMIPVPMSLLGSFARTRQPEFSARYYPPDTVAYTWITLDPRGRQMRYMREIWQTFNEYPGFVSAVEDWKTGFAEETGMSFDEDVATWIGPTLSAGLLNIDADDGHPTVVALIGVRDDSEAADFLDMWTGYVLAHGEAEFDLGTYRESQTWVSSDGGHAYALSDGWLVYATDEDSLNAILDRIDGANQDTLAKSIKFRSARETLPETRFASAYVDLDRSDGILGEWSGAFGAASLPMSGLADGSKDTEEWLAVSATWVDRGLVTEWVTPSGAENELNVADLDDPAPLLPVDALGFVAASFDPDLDNWRAALSERQLSDVVPRIGPVAGLEGMLPGFGEGDAQLVEDAALVDALDLGLELVREATGIDLETEFFDHLDGTAILALHDFDIRAAREDPTATPVHAVGMLSYQPDERDGLNRTMNRVADLAQTQAGISAEAVEVGAEGPAMVFDLSPLAMLAGVDAGYRPGYVLHDQYLTIGTTEQALRAVVELQNGQGENLSTHAEYRRAMQYLPASRQIAGYVNGHRIVGQLEAEDLRMEADEYAVVRDAMGVLVFGSNAGESHTRNVAVLTLFPE